MKFKEHHWQLHDNVKVIVLSLELQSGFTKYCCFLCIATEHHYVACQEGKSSYMHKAVLNIRHSGSTVGTSASIAYKAWPKIVMVLNTKIKSLQN
jgi:hypothetical protein